MSARQLAVKELKALAVPWLTCLAAMIGSVFMGGEFRRLGILAYFFGTTGLGALSIGHEYSHRTLSMLLAQPVDRRRVLATKLGVVAALLAVTAAVGALSVFNQTSLLEFDTGPRRLAAILLPVLGALTLAPYLTMVCRSPVAGILFTGAIPAGLLVGGTLIVVKLFGSGNIEALQLAFFVEGMPVLCALAALMTWRTFMRLEAIDGGGPDVRLPRWLRVGSGDQADSLTRRHPIWQLAKKEVRLQAMPFTLAGLYVLGWAVATLLSGEVWIGDATRGGHPAMEVFRVMTFFYSVSVALLIGSNASAEERQLGTLPSQLLMPLAVSTQWAVKVTATLALSLLVTIGLPSLLAVIGPAIVGDIPSPTRLIGLQTLLSVLFTIAGLYVSSMTTGGLRALMASLPALLAGGWLVSFLIRFLGSPAGDALSRLFRLPTVSPVNRMCCGTPFPSAFDSRILDGVAVVLAAGVLLLVLRFALANHRSTDGVRARVCTQAIWMAVCLAARLMVLAAVDTFQRRAANGRPPLTVAGQGSFKELR